MIQAERVRRLNHHSPQQGRFVLYWMQAAQRAEYNHALEYAVEQANEAGLPLVTLFALMDDYPSANWRHYQFMLEGLRETAGALRERKILFVLRRQSPAAAVAALAKQAALVVTDRGYTRVQRQWRDEIAESIACPLIQVEGEVIFPVEQVSDKEEYAARTIRGKIQKLTDSYMTPLRAGTVKHSSLGMDIETESPDDVENLLASMTIDRSVPPAPLLRGGSSEARRILREFISGKLSAYDKDRNDPNLDGCSTMSPYLHFGQISPLYIALNVIKAGGGGAEAYLEELIVRREVAMNYVRYNAHYDSFDGLPAWARATLKEHQADQRPYLYDRDELEQGRTHDAAWNAAQMEMALTGKMHNYMRMYWGKKILEWQRSPRRAFATAVYLNDKYELDGRDPNGYAGVAWCFGKHDRPWARRPIFGCIRYMNDSGLKRKFDVDGYIQKINSMRQMYQGKE